MATSARLSSVSVGLRWRTPTVGPFSTTIHPRRSHRAVSLKRAGHHRRRRASRERFSPVDRPPRPREILSRNISGREAREKREKDARCESRRDLAARPDQLIGGRRFGRETPAREANRRRARDNFTRVRCQCPLSRPLEQLPASPSSPLSSSSFLSVEPS